MVRASGNEVFALGDKTGTRHCLVAVTGTGGEERGAPSNDGDASNLAGPDPSSKRQCRTGAARVPPVGGFCPPPIDDQAHGEDGNGGNGLPGSFLCFCLLGRGSETRCSCWRGRGLLSCFLADH